MKRLVIACTLLLTACGSSEEGGLFGSASASASGGTESGGANALGGSAGVSGATSGGAGGLGGVSSGGSAGGAESGGSAGSGGDVSSGGQGATGGNPAAGTISCGGVNNCARPGNFCCVYLSGSFPTPTCQANAAPCVAGSELFCDGPEDCINGNVCCGHLVNSRFGQAYNELKCTPANECVYSQGRRLICGNEKCPSGLECKASSLLPNINVCSPN